MAGPRGSLAAVSGDDFGGRLRSARQSKDLTQAELAEQFGVRQQTIGAWERNERPQAKHYPRLRELLGLPDELALIRLINNSRRDGAEEARQQPETDGEVMKLLAVTLARSMEQRKAGLTDEEVQLRRDEVAALKEFSKYFLLRARDAASSEGD